MPDKLTKYILENGLTVYFYNDDAKHTVHAELITKFGGMTKDFIYKNQEYHICDGIAHLLEHFICEQGRNGNYIKLVGDKLLSSNAFTNQYCTRYYIDGVENIEYALECMLDNVYNPVFTNENFEKVKKPILEEIRRSNDRKFFEFGEKYHESIFHHNRYRSTIGTIKEIETLDLDTVKTCYDAFYKPANQFLLIAGNFDKEKYLNLIKNFFANQKTDKFLAKVIKYDEPKTVKKEKYTVYKKTAHPYTAISYKINIEDYSPREKLNLESILNSYFSINFGYASDTRKNLVDNGIVIGNINTYIIFYDNYVICSVEAYNTNSKIFIDTIKRVMDEKILDKELFELDKKETLTRFIMRFDSLGSIGMPFIDNIIVFDYPYLDEAKDFDIPYAMYKETIEKLDFSNYTIGHLIDPKCKEESKN